MDFKSLTLAASTLVLSISVNAATVTQGHLTSDDQTNIISDSLNSVEYLRLNVLADLNYAETLAVLDTQDGGGWHIATPTDAINFTTALLDGSTTCGHNGTSVTQTGCGTAATWNDGQLGDNYHGLDDYAWFMDNSGEADYIQINQNGTVQIADFDLATSEFYSHDPGSNITWLVVRPAVVPVPAAIWLFGSGLIGLVGFARRKV